LWFTYQGDKYMMRDLINLLDSITESRGLSARKPGEMYSRGETDDDKIVFKSLTFYPEVGSYATASEFMDAWMDVERDAGHPIEKPETIATAIRIGKPASWDLAIAARDDSGGLIDSVTDDQILQAYRLLADKEGFFVEPSSAASVAGLLQQAQRGLVDAGSTIVCTVTGNGLKDTQWALESAKDPVVVPVDVKAAAAALGLA
jgi:hypothetical protein